MSLNFDGLLIAVLTLVAIAFGHVFVRNAYRVFGLKVWPVSLCRVWRCRRGAYSFRIR